MIRNNLFILNFNIFVRRILGILLIYLLIYNCINLLNYIYHPTDQVSRKLMHDYYEFDESIDNLTLGSSHVYCDINPWQLDELNGMVNYNLSYDGMQLDSAYYILREAIKTHDLKSVNLELYYDVQLRSRDKIQLWRLFDYLNWSSLKIDFLHTSFEKDEYLETLIPFLRHRSALFDLKQICNILNLKQSDKFKNYQLASKHSSNDYIKYLEKGFRETNKIFNETDLKVNSVLSLHENINLSQTSRIYLDKIIRLCQKENIEIILFCSPEHDLRLLGEDGYDYYHMLINEIANEYSIPFYDFNLIKDEYFNSSILMYHADDNHLNSFGAKAFTTAFNTVINSEDPSIYFHNTYVDKMDSRQPQMYGIIINNDIVSILSNKQNDLEYKITQIMENEEIKLIQDFDNNINLIIYDQEGFLEIEYRLLGDNENLNTLRISLQQ